MNKFYMFYMRTAPARDTHISWQKQVKILTRKRNYSVKKRFFFSLHFILFADNKSVKLIPCPLLWYTILYSIKKLYLLIVNDKRNKSRHFTFQVLILAEQNE